MISKGDRLAYLYVLNEGHKADINVLSAQIWHNRLGRLSFKNLEFLKNKLAYVSCNKNIPCHVCPLAKQRRLPFVSHNYTV